MPKNKSRAPQTSDTKEARLVAAQSFIKSDRIRHKITGKIGVFDSINLGFALPEIWVQFETDTEFRVPISCNPLELERFEQCQEDIESSVGTQGLGVCATEVSVKRDLSTSSKLPSSLSCIPLDQKRQGAGGFLAGELPPTPACEALRNTERAPHPIQVGYQEPDVLTPAREIPSPLPLDDESSSPDTTHTSLGITTSETLVQSEESSMSSAVGLHARESVELTPTAKDEIWSAPASAITCSDSSTTLDIPDGWTDILKPDGEQLTLTLATSASTNGYGHAPVGQSTILQ